MPAPETYFTGSDEFIVNSYTNGRQGDPSIASLSDGGFVIVWESDGPDGDRFGIYGQRFHADGTPNGSEFQINTHTSNWQIGPSVTSLSDDGFLVTWTSSWQDGYGGGIYGQRFHADGTSNGSEFQINTFTNTSQTDPSIASLSGGDFVVIWQSSDGQDGSGDGIYGQRYNADSTPNGGEFQVNTYTDDDQSNPAVAGLSDGSFVVTWHSVGQDGSDEGVYGQRYNADGSPNSGEFQVNTTTEESQGGSFIAALPDGGFIVAWTSHFDLKGQRYNADGSPSGGEFLINSYPVTSQWAPSIAVESDGDFVVTWERWSDEGTAWHYDVYGQRYNADGTPDGDEFRVNDYTVASQQRPAITSLSDGKVAIVWQGDNQDHFGEGIIGKIYAPVTENLFVATEDSETFEGSYGIDTVDFRNGGAVYIDLADGDAHGGYAQGDTLILIDNLIGSASADVLRGDHRNNVLCGGEGNDLLKGQAGADILKGEGGDDILWGNYGDDILIGGEGADWMKGGDGRDTFLFTSLDGSVDTIVDMNPEDIIDVTEILGGVPGSEDPEIFSAGFLHYAKNGSDVDLYIDPDGAEGPASEVLLAVLLNRNVSEFSTSGNDTLEGAEGNDTLKGHRGNDTLLGNGGADALWGNSGSDTLYGGEGTDWMKGGDGSDLFVLDGADSGFDTINDFRSDNGDRIQIMDILSFDPLLDDIADFVEITQSGFNSIISVDLDGAAGGQSFTPIAETTGITDLDVAQMFAEGELIISDVIV